ncbi:hypothetical protein BJ138DRAFT_1117639 [Hygrophoropsis aurantiaca]|uniref:Uncharacterized protein n=1 Tax=Hygrophoropsis aurantiaca TaxID=72124 RepID=A0ACB8A078_9AGAM|nr:hypothetical protein BJ138DRAFT_1117639 [Hygrophoropsis aurantiaca]
MLLPANAPGSHILAVSAVNNEVQPGVDNLAALLGSLSLTPDSASTLITAIIGATTSSTTPPASVSASDDSTASETSIDDSPAATVAPSSPTIITTAPPVDAVVLVDAAHEAPAVPTPPSERSILVAATNAAAAAAALDASLGIPADPPISIAPSPPPAPQIWSQVYRGFTYDVPRPDATGPFYCVTVGTRVGIFSPWQATSPFVTGVTRACQSRVLTLALGITQFHTILEAGNVELIV